MYANAQINWQHGGDTVMLTTETDQPTGGSVRISMTVPTPQSFIVRLRIPSWAASSVEISVNGERQAVGTAGSYCAIERTWSDGDTISFTLPLALRLTKYRGADGVAGFDRYAVEYGSLLLGIVGSLDFRDKYIRIEKDPLDPETWMEPVTGKPGHFTVKGKPGVRVYPILRDSRSDVHLLSGNWIAPQFSTDQELSGGCPTCFRKALPICWIARAARR